MKKWINIFGFLVYFCDFICICVRVCMRVCTYLCVCVCVSVRINVSLFLSLRMYVFACTYVCFSVFISVCPPTHSCALSLPPLSLSVRVVRMCVSWADKITFLFRSYNQSNTTSVSLVIQKHFFGMCKCKYRAFSRNKWSERKNNELFYFRFTLKCLVVQLIHPFVDETWGWDSNHGQLGRVQFHQRFSLVNGSKLDVIVP